MAKGKLLAKNRKALFNHTIIDRFDAGIVLKGYEVKAIREGKVDFEGSYIKTDAREVYVINLNIGRYSKQDKESESFNPKRDRKLLLNKNEISEVSREISQKGKTAVPLALVLSNNKIKLEFAVVKGKKEFEKKQTAKERQIRKDMKIQEKEYRKSDY
ncbi:SsrA-binding protein SmpB [Patescibacteria group bacterium]|nr:SsrA-binding protein SmpB [Patescibacteria group bacterium]